MKIVQHEDSINMPINDFSFTPIMLGLLDAKANPIPSASLYSFTVLYKRYYNVEMLDGSMKVNATIENLKMEDCNKLKNNYFSTFKPVSGYYDYNKCIIPNNNTELILHGRFPDSTDKFSTIQIIVNKCDQKKEKCFDDFTAAQLLNGAFISIMYNSSYLDPYNSVPYGTKLQSEIFPISFSIKKKFAYYINQINFFSDDGWFFKSEKMYNFFRSSNYVLDIDDSQIDAFTKVPFYLTVAIRNSDNIFIYYRSYEKLPQLFAGIASVANIIFIISRYLVDYFSYDQIILNLISKLFYNKNLCTENIPEIQINLPKSGFAKNNSLSKINLYSIKKRINFKCKEYLFYKILCKYSDKLKNSKNMKNSSEAY